METKTENSLAYRNLQRLIEAYLREESSMRWGATDAQIQDAAKKMMQNRTIPASLARGLREKIDAISQQSAG